jgi:hypothetical protein
MNSKGTWFWFLLAVGLFLFILLVERHWNQPPPGAGQPLKLIADLQPNVVTNLQIRCGQQVVRLNREGDAWQLTAPVHYPAQPVLVKNLLEALVRLDRRTPIYSISSYADYGLADPQAVIFVQVGAKRSEIQLGNLTPAGDQVYVRHVGIEGIYTAEAALLKLIPTSANAWRTLALLTSPTSTMFDRFEVRSPARGLGFSLNYNLTNRFWRLSKPMQARADHGKVENLLRKFLEGRITEFVTDDPAADLERFGLQPPAAELVLGNGTNDILSIQFGISPTNRPDLVYARRLSHTNVVLIPREMADTLQVPFTEFRDRHLLTFPPNAVSQIELRGQENILIRKQGTNLWRILEPQEWPADAAMVRELIADLYSLEVAEFEKDVVTDFAGYGLVQPLLQVLLKTTAPPTTNTTTTTNIVLAQADFGTNVQTRLFAHRPDENSVYAIREEDFLKLPAFAWQLRDRRIWNFSITNVARLTISQQGRVNQFIRKGTNDWMFAPGSQGILNEFAVEEIAFRLGDLTANAWLDRGETARTQSGFSRDGYRVEIEVREGDRLQNYVVDFGKPSRAQVPLACVTLDGQPWIFDFPWQLYQMMIRDLPLPKVPLGKQP